MIRSILPFLRRLRMASLRTRQGDRFEGSLSGDTNWKLQNRPGVASAQQLGEETGGLGNASVMKGAGTIGAKSPWRFGDNYCVHYEEYLQPISFQYCFKMAATIRGGHFVAILIRGWWECVKVWPKDVT